MKGPVTLVDRAASALIWILAGGFLVVMTTVLAVLYRFVPADRLQWLERFYCRLQIALTFSRVTHHVHPAVDTNTSYIFLQNHSSQLDHVAMYTATPHFKQGVELESHFAYPFYGWLMKGRGTIPVPAGRTKALRALRDAVRSEIDAGHSVLAFPEGHRTITGRVGRFYDGLFWVAVELGVPVVPVAVTGLYEVLHKGSLIIRPGGEIEVFVEEPIATENLEARDVAALRDRVRDIIAARVDAHFADA